jgi:hypothetical protein
MLTISEAQNLKIATKLKLVRSEHLWYVTTVRAWEERRRQKVLVELVRDDGLLESYFDETRLQFISFPTEEDADPPEKVQEKKTKKASSKTRKAKPKAKK